MRTRPGRRSRGNHRIGVRRAVGGRPNSAVVRARREISSEIPDATQKFSNGVAPARDEDTDEAAYDDVTVERDPGLTDGTDPDDDAPRGNRPAGDAADWPCVAGYEIHLRLGEGGMGVVYKARHLGLNRLVALKMIRGGSQARSDYFTRFRVEAEAVARLRHPNIIQIYDIGEAGGLPFVALELLDGGSLDHRLGGNPQAGRQAAELMVTLARAVHVAHESGIVHRDLKPSNVLYTSDDVPKVTDFGLAKLIDSDDGQTQSGQIMGSPSYMAPSRRGVTRESWVRRPTSMPWAPCSTRCSPGGRRSRARPRWRRYARSSTTTR